jgi:hypothetical protein
MFLKSMLAKFMLANKNQIINGLPLSAAVMSEFASVEEFVMMSVSKPNEEASLLVIVIAPDLLRISVDIALFDSKDQVLLLYHLSINSLRKITLLKDYPAP